MDCAGSAAAAVASSTPRLSRVYRPHRPASTGVGDDGPRVVDRVKPNHGGAEAELFYFTAVYLLMHHDVAVCSGGVVRPIILPSHGNDLGSNPSRSILSSRRLVVFACAVTHVRLNV